jgi:hypothetical protein
MQDKTKKTKKESEVRDLKPRKDAKGGTLNFSRPTAKGGTLRPSDPPSE